MDISKAPIAKPDYRDADRNEDVYVFYGGYSTTEFRVPADTEVRKQDQRWSNRRQGSDPRETLPNLEVKDGVIVLPFADLVGLIIERADPTELAKELWANDDVRAEFLHCLTSRYSDDNVTDADRRKFLRDVKEEVHSRALDQLVTKLNDLEYNAREAQRVRHDGWRYDGHYRNVLDTVEGIAGADVKAKLIARFGERYNSGLADHEDFQIGRKHWNEARDYWRKKTLELFPEPEPVKSEDPADFLFGPTPIAGGL